MLEGSKGPSNFTGFSQLHTSSLFAMKALGRTECALIRFFPEDRRWLWLFCNVLGTRSAAGQVVGDDGAVVPNRGQMLTHVLCAVSVKEMR